MGTYQDLMYGLMRIPTLSLVPIDGNLYISMSQEKGRGDVQIQAADINRPRPSSIQVIQKIYFSPSSSSSSSGLPISSSRQDGDFLNRDEIERPSPASRIVKATQRMVTQIKADVVPNAWTSSSVRVSFAAH